MKISIRRGVFETNSSSVHAICICKEKSYIDYLNEWSGKTVHFHTGKFRWGFDVLTTVEDKASYLYQALLHMNANDFSIQDWICDTLGGYGISCEFEKIPDDDWEVYEGKTYYEGSGYIDHWGKVADFVNKISYNKVALLQYLFGSSIVVIGTDNGDAIYDYMYEEGHDWDNRELKKKFNNFDIIWKVN